jgi:hypothetical protein
MQYKGRLEEWYVTQQGVFTYMVCILLTVWVVARPESPAVWKLFRGLPEPPESLLPILRPEFADAGRS